MKILIAYDGSACSDAALDDLRNAGLPSVADTLIAAVIGDVDVLAADGAEVDLSEAAIIENSLARASARLAAQFPEWRLEERELAGMPGEQILALAREWSPDLILVGSHGRNWLQRMVLGSVSLRVLREARCTVRVGRRRPVPKNGGLRIMIAVDGSRHSEAAVQEAISRHWPAGTKARLITIHQPVAGIYGVGTATREELERAHANHERLLPVLRNAGLEASSIIDEDNVASRIVYESEQWSANCIFIGARGLGPMASLFLGSVSSAVAERAHCSVEIVHLRD